MYPHIAKDELNIAIDTNQFFDITRYNLQSMPITKQNIDLVFLLEQLVEESYPMLQEKKLECILNKPKAIQFMGDGDKLARAFGNLLKNAINYSYLNTTNWKKYLINSIEQMNQEHLAQGEQD